MRHVCHEHVLSARERASGCYRYMATPEALAYSPVIDGALLIQW
jgi:hypothetical protein